MFGLLVALVGVSAGATAMSVVESRKSAKAQRKANDVNRKIQERQAVRERMQALREAQIARAQGQQLAANTGTVDTSGFMGQQAGIAAQTASNIAFSTRNSTGAEVIGAYTQKASDASVRSANWGALAQLSLAATQFVQPTPTQTAPTKKPTTPIQ